MRDAILFLAFFAIIPYIFKRPVVGALAYAVVSLMNPHRLTYGPAYGFPFAMILCVLTLLSLLVSKEAKKLPGTPSVIVLFLFILWMNITSLFALEPQLVWIGWERVMKVMLMTCVTVITVRTVTDVKMLALVVAMSLGFWGFKGGVYTILSGGHSGGLLGPEGSFITDNNTLALAMVATVPLLVYLVSQANTKWLKRGAILMALLTAIAALGSYSRGALVGASAMALFLWLKSHSKAKTGVLLLLLAPTVLLLMPDQWMGRMHTINSYQEDASAMGRINSWEFALNVANHFPLGGGFNAFSPNMFKLYAPLPNFFHVAHSIYFQVLGEHGYIGLALFLLLLFTSWRTGSRVIAFVKDKPDLAWAGTLARMCQVSLIGYMTAGAFLTLAYYDLLYYIFAILITMEKVLVLYPQRDDAPPLRLPFRWGQNKRAPAWPETGRPNL